MEPKTTTIDFENCSTSWGYTERIFLIGSLRTTTEHRALRPQYSFISLYIIYTLYMGFITRIIIVLFRYNLIWHWSHVVQSSDLFLVIWGQSSAIILFLKEFISICEEKKLRKKKKGEEEILQRQRRRFADWKFCLKIWEKIFETNVRV
jgi:hypothetical protein